MTLFFWARNTSWSFSDWLFRHLRFNRLLIRRSRWMSSLYQGNLGHMVRSLVVIGNTSLSTDNVIDSYASVRTLGSTESKGKSDKRLIRRSVKLSGFNLSKTELAWTCRWWFLIAERACYKAGIRVILGKNSIFLMIWSFSFVSSMSRVRPLLWVGPLINWKKPLLSRMSLNFLVSDLSGSSTWIL